MSGASIDHWFYGKSHALLDDQACFWGSIMKYLGLFVEYSANAMAAIFSHYRIMIGLCVLLNDIADVTEGGPGADNVYCLIKAFLGYFHQFLGVGGHFPDQKHLAGIAVKAILDDRDVNID